MSRIVSSPAPLSAKSAINVCRLSRQRPVTPAALRTLDQGGLSVAVGPHRVLRPRLAEREHVPIRLNRAEPPRVPFGILRHRGKKVGAQRMLPPVARRGGTTVFSRKEMLVDAQVGRSTPA